MNFIKKATSALIFLTATLTYSQNAQDIVWERPTLESGSYTASGISGSNDKYSAKENESTTDFTPAYDYKNSLNSLSIITFSLNKPGFVNIRIYDEKGNTVDEIARSSFGAGKHELKWNSSKFGASSFYCSIITGEFSTTKKIK
jgi:hypothetical protein